MAVITDAVYSKVFNVVGVNHRTLPIEGREILSGLSRSGEFDLHKVAGDFGLQEAAILSTCNRFEIISVGHDRGEELAGFIGSRLGASTPDNGIYQFKNKDALRHLFRVASSLDSMVVGEAQILGQVKDAYRLAVDSGLAGKHLHHLFQFSFGLAKKVRENTAVAEKGVSVSYVAVKLAEQIFGEMKNRSVLIIGSGKMAELAALHLRAYGCNQIIVANRTLEKASELAERISGSAVPLSEVYSYLGSVDVVISSISADKPVIERNELRKIKRGRPIFMIDLGVPRNLPASLGGLDDVFLYNLDDLASIADENRELREEAAREAEIIIDYGIFQFERWLVKISAEPAILDFRARVRDVCRDELQQRLAGRIEREHIEEIVQNLSHGISQRISHGISEMIARAPEGKVDESVLLPLVFEDFLKIM
jgi:glutamyl-tRNA reductase